MEQHYCFLYTGAKEEEIAFEVWDGIDRRSSSSDPILYTDGYLCSDGFYRIKPFGDLLTYTDWLNRIRPLQVGDVVEVLEDVDEPGNKAGWLNQFDEYIGKHFIVQDISDLGNPVLSNRWNFRPHRLRLISRAEQPTATWTPKWGDEVMIPSCCASQPQTGIVKVSFKADSGDTMYVVQVGEDSWRITSDIKQIPPKPKTLREEVAELLLTDRPNAMFTEGFKSGIRNVLAIIDRHEKGGENE